MRYKIPVLVLLLSDCRIYTRGTYTCACVLYLGYRTRNKITMGANETTFIVKHLIGVYVA